MITLRKASPADYQQIKELFKTTIVTINSKDYNKEQIDRWSEAAEQEERWLNRMTSQYFIVAEIKAQIVGFCSLQDDGYLDVLFVHKDFQARGIAKMLVKQIYKKAEGWDLHKIFAEVSITAKPFFEKEGFQVNKQQEKFIGDVAFTNFLMTRKI